MPPGWPSEGPGRECQNHSHCWQSARHNSAGTNLDVARRCPGHWCAHHTANTCVRADKAGRWGKSACHCVSSNATRIKRGTVSASIITYMSNNMKKQLWENLKTESMNLEPERLTFSIVSQLQYRLAARRFWARRCTVGGSTPPNPWCRGTTSLCSGPPLGTRGCGHASPPSAQAAQSSEKTWGSLEIYAKKL